MKAKFEKISTAELTRYVLTHREDLDTLEALVNRRTPDSEATFYPPPCTPEGEPIPENLQIMETAIQERIAAIEKKKKSQKKE
ncbi:MAG: hypothetical protein SAJ37_03360 [Oscillatoria sp. PMC 1068.18]|nr:hypothetical protein [Oscillatoria sp. PMC 1076.18]MEC4987764.1 hypothetical protein [Oscillatoria sp. PMC 1068.18]